MKPGVYLHNLQKLQEVNPESLQILKRYEIDMTMRNLADGTKYQYTLDLQAWFIYVLLYQENKSVLELNEDDITEFLFYCKQQGNNAERIRLRIAGISAFYRFMRKKKYLRDSPTEFIDRPKRNLRVIQQTYLTPEQVALMREKLIDTNDIQLRIYATLSLSTMARVSAISRIRWDQIDMQNKVIHNVLEKEGKLVDLFFSDEVKCLLQRLKDERAKKHADDYGWLFHDTKSRERSISTTTLNSWAHKIGDMIGVPSLHPHDFRHSGATLLKNAGMTLEDISTLLAHESTETTKKYYIKEDIAKLSARKNVYNI